LLPADWFISARASNVSVRSVVQFFISASCSGLLATLALVLLSGISLAAPVAAPSPAQPAAPNFAAIDNLVAEALAQNHMPGCVVVVGRGSGVVYQKAFGARALLPERQEMTLDTVFDLASLTKPIATATAMMALVDRGKVDLDEKVAHYWPPFAAKRPSRFATCWSTCRVCQPRPRWPNTRWGGRRY
jgi:CubicO group peptidase (beta-lactamase class C family)